jgi:hypothetical protein
MVFKMIYAKIIYFKVLKQFCSMIDFKSQDFDEALRILLARFKLPGEVKKNNFFLFINFII